MEVALEQASDWGLAVTFTKRQPPHNRGLPCLFWLQFCVPYHYRFITVG
jgi:hypothetical protein